MSDTPRTDRLTSTFYMRCDECPNRVGPDDILKSIHPDYYRDLELQLSQSEAARKLAEEEKAAAIVATEEANCRCNGALACADLAESRVKELEKAIKGLIGTAFHHSAVKIARAVLTKEKP